MMLLHRDTELKMTSRLLLLVVALSALTMADIVRITTERRLEDISDVDYSSSEELPMEDVGIEDENTITEERSEDRVHAHIMAALKRPDLKKQMGQILPIIRAMSPPQRLTLAALITSQVMDSSPPTLNEVSAMFGIDPDAPEHIKRNITSSLLLPISYDIARMFKGPSQGPQAQQYRSFRPPPPQWSFRPPPPGANRRNTHVYTAMLPPPPPQPRQPPADLTIPPDKEHCEFFSQSLCLEVTDYPRQAIMASLRASEGYLDDVLIPDRTGEEGTVPEVADRRQDGAGSPASMCSSVTKLARPKRARTTGGEWKYIVNTGQYVQTLRLEMCQNPQESCSYISDNFRSECSQVYNYHRLLTWDDNKGLHMDVFKVPTCCSCQVKGYAVNFPPKGHNAPQRFPGADLVVNENFGGSNAQQFDNFNFHDESHLLRQGAAIEQALNEGNMKISVQNQVGQLGNEVPPHYDLRHYNTLKRGDLGLGLVPPRVPGPFFDNNIRRSRNETGHMDKRVYEETDEGAPDVNQMSPGRRGEQGAPDHYPPDVVRVSQRPQITPGRRGETGAPIHNPPDVVRAPQRPQMNPGRRAPPLPPREQAPPVHNPPEVVRVSQRPQMNPGRRVPPQPPTLERPPNPYQRNPLAPSTTEQTEANNEVQTDGKRVNYSYHPIIDFFKARGETDRLESRSGEGWRPIIGPKVK